jgi:hypothetical protein
MQLKRDLIDFLENIFCFKGQKFLNQNRRNSQTHIVKEDYELLAPSIRLGKAAL